MDKPEVNFDKDEYNSNVFECVNCEGNVKSIVSKGKRCNCSHGDRCIRVDINVNGRIMCILIYTGHRLA